MKETNDLQELSESLNKLMEKIKDSEDKKIEEIIMKSKEILEACLKDSA
jgi:ElaB/YqjD/DUF883 family membrane-anchored ribosome-binding protein